MSKTKTVKKPKPKPKPKTPAKTRAVPRRALSVKGTTYIKAQAYCREKGLTVSGLVENLLATHLGILEVVVSCPVAARQESLRFEEPLFSLVTETAAPATTEPVRGGGTHLL